MPVVDPPHSFTWVQGFFSWVNIDHMAFTASLTLPTFEKLRTYILSYFSDMHVPPACDLVLGPVLN